MIEITFIFSGNNLTLNVNSSSLLKDILKYFLSRTNSLLTLDSNKILFLYKSILLITPKYLDKKIKEIFKNFFRVNVFDIRFLIYRRRYESWS